MFGLVTILKVVRKRLDKFNFIARNFTCAQGRACKKRARKTKVRLIGKQRDIFLMYFHQKFLQ